MKRLILIVALAGLAGCSTFTPKEMTYLRSAGIPPYTMAKLERGRPLTPSEIISLHSRGIPESYLLRHIDDHEVDYLVTRTDLTRMRKAGVSTAVIDAVIAESEDFAEDYTRTTGVMVYDDPWYFDPMYPGPRLYSPYWW